MTHSDTTIERVETWYVRVPLAQPIQLGSLTIANRDFVVLRVRTAGGLDGWAYSLTRGAPLDLVISDMVAPQLIGKDALQIDALVDRMRHAVTHLGPVGLVGRGISLAEICLWDIKGQLAGMPVHRLLGGARTSTQVMVVAPYALPGEADEAYAERLVPYAQRGYCALKLYPLADPDAMTRRLDAIRRTLGDTIGLVVDMGWMFRSAAQAIDAVQRWEHIGLTWVEDPFPSWEHQSMKALADAVRTPIAAGDEVSVPTVMETLIERRAVDVVRLDATSLGGFGAFGRLAAAAHAAGYQVSHHAYGEIQQHCVFAWPGVWPVELFPPGSPTLGTGRFLTRELDLPVGATELPAPEEPGLGLGIDLDAVTALSLRHTEVGA